MQLWLAVTKTFPCHLFWSQPGLKSARSTPLESAVLPTILLPLPLATSIPVERLFVAVLPVSTFADDPGEPVRKIPTPSSFVVTCSIDERLTPANPTAHCSKPVIGPRPSLCS